MRYMGPRVWENLGHVLGEDQRTPRPGQKGKLEPKGHQGVSGLKKAKQKKQKGHSGRSVEWWAAVFLGGSGLFSTDIPPLVLKQ